MMYTILRWYSKVSNTNGHRLQIFHWKFQVVLRNTWNNGGTILVYDLQGQPIYQSKFDNTEGQIVINTSSWNQGVYVISVVSDSGPIAHQKLVISK